MFHTSGFPPVAGRVYAQSFINSLLTSIYPFIGLTTSPVEGCVAAWANPS